MNTKTMRLPPRRISTTNASNNSNKRKERESGLDALQQSTTTKTLKLAPPPQASPSSEPPALSGQLLAGYLAHEFLTKGTLLGQPWDSARAEPTTPPATSASGEAEPRFGAEPKYESLERYVEVADLLKTDGAHLAGIVNPTQLARFLQL